MKNISIPDEMYSELLRLANDNKEDYTNNETKLISDFLYEITKNDDAEIKKLNKRLREIIPIKTKIYNYFKERLYEKEAERENTTVEVIRNMSEKQPETVWERLMLYFICLISINENDKSLFNIFNLWHAYPNGPVEVDCFNIDYNKNYKNGDIFVEYLSIKLDMLTYPFIIINDYEKIINDTLDILYSQDSKLKFHFTPIDIDSDINDYLIYLTHNLYLWHITIDRKNREIDLTIPELLKEKKEFLKLL